jgi:hypothetical protein
MSGNTTDFSQIALDQFGRALLPDEMLDALENVLTVETAGGSNSSCTNTPKCDGSTNGTCSNPVACMDTSNSHCDTPREVGGG